MNGLLYKPFHHNVHIILRDSQILVNIQVRLEMVSGQQGYFPAFLQNSLSTGVTKVSVQFSLKVSVNSAWRRVVRRRAEEVLGGAGAGLLTDWLHLDADGGNRLARRRVWRRVSGVEAHLGVGRWGGAGDLQVQSDAEKQWWNSLLLHQPPFIQFQVQRLT